MYESGLLIEDALLRFSEASDTPKYYYFDNGISGYYNRYLDDVGFNDTLIPLSVVNNVEGAEVLVVPGETYNGVHMASPQDYGQPGGPFVTRTFACVNASVDDTKLERILRVFDDMSFEYENAFYLWNGTEGRDYTMETTAAGWERRVPVEDADLVAVGTRVTAGYYLPAWYYEDYIKSAGAAYEMYLAWGNAQEYLDARLYDYRYDFENETDIITVLRQTMIRLWKH